MALVVACALPNLSSATLQSSENATGVSKKLRSDTVPGEFIVRFRADSASATKTMQVEQLDVANKGQIPMTVVALGAVEIVSGLRLVKVVTEDTTGVLEALRARPDVLYAEPNFIRRKTATPSDARFSDLWALKNTGQVGGTAGADIRAEQAWDITTGSRDVVVAVIDEGIDVNHQDLQSNIWRNPGETAGNGVDDDGNGYVDDINGYDFFHNDSSVYDGPGTNPDGTVIDAHGTHVAGTIGAAGNNGIGVVGVNWQVSVMSLKFLGPDGGSTADLLKALTYAKMMRDRWVTSGGTTGANIRVTNNSYGGGSYSQAESDAIEATGSSGILFVTSSGNESQDNNNLGTYPAGYDLANLISVAATDRLDNFAFFSNKGSRTVHIGAPGVSILSTTPGNTYSFADGTSMASPQVAGAAALVLAAHGNFSVARVRAAILFGGQAITSLAQTTLTGNRLDARGALQNAAENDSTSPAAVSDLHITGQVGRGVTLAWTATGDDGLGGRASLHELRFVDQATGARYRIGGQRPLPAGSQEFAEVFIPYRHTAGAITLVTSDKAGNSVTASVNVNVNPDAAEPYTISEGPAEALSTGGGRINANFDDALVSWNLPFNFPFFERYGSNMVLSTNGAIYFPPSAPGPYDVVSSSGYLSGFQIIAGLWDDLDLRTSSRADADIYVVNPDANRTIFRWQGVPCNANLTTGQCTGGGPVNFEIELRRDGTIIKRYGDGNTQLHPVVGIGGGEPDAYPIASHSSETAPKDLTNAPTVTYALRTQPAKADLEVRTRAYPNVVVAGQNVTYTATVNNIGPDTGSGVTFSNTLPISTQFVSCTASQGTCSGAGGSSRLVTGALGPISSGGSVTVTIVAKVLVYQNTYDNSSSVSARTYDPNPSNSSFTTITGYVANPNPIGGITAISNGTGHSLAIGPDGFVLAWGMNTFGQLGDGSTQTRNTPVFVKRLDGIKAIAAGSGFSVAVKTSGTVWTWGLNDGGQIGDGTNTTRIEPVQVPGLTGMVAVASTLHTVALKGDGTVWTWGVNTNGELGDNTTDPRLTAAMVNGLTGVSGVAAGLGHSVVVKNDGTVWTWGDNSQGQLGDGTTVSKRLPIQVPGLSGITRVSSWGNFSVALKNDGTVWTWGANNLGQIGDGTTVMRTSPVQVTGLSSVTAIASGIAHTLALKDDGSVWAWGLNGSGQLGVGMDLSPNNYLAVPAPVIILSGATAIAAGYDGSLALTANGSVFAWGSSGLRFYPYQMTAPAPRPPLQAVTFNPDGGTFHSPQAVTISYPSNPATLQSIALGGGHSLALMSDGKVFAWGSNQNFEIGQPPSVQQSTVPVPVNGIDSVTALIGGNGFSLALKNDGTVWGWGLNGSGVTGPPATSATPVPHQVMGVSNMVTIAAGGEHALGIRSDGTVWTWGSNQYGQLGDGSTTPRNAPVQAVGLTNIIAIGGGAYHSIALKSDGTVWVWGDNRHGEMGDGTISISRATPSQVPGFTNATGVAAAVFRCAVLRSDGTVWSWGDNSYGQLGDGTTTLRQTPVMASGMSGAIALRAAGFSTIALRNDSTVWTWGNNDRAQLGTGYPPFSRPSPAQIPNFTGLGGINIGSSHMAATLTNGVVWVWGDNSSGQLGDGTNFIRVGPVALEYFSTGPKIHYTTNGADPTTDDPVVDSGGTVLLTRNTVLKAKVFREGFAPSTIKSANFVIDVNQINDAAFFVTQHYRDFLNREPDAAGLAFWVDQINSCGSDQACIELRRINVSAAFFRSIEFQQTGYLVERLYKAAYGDVLGTATFGGSHQLSVPVVRFNEFLPDTQQIGLGVVVNQPGWEQVLENNKQNFIAAFVQRSRFTNAYPAMSAAQFVDTLNTNAGGPLSAAERDQLVSELSSGAKTRAQVLRAVAEDHDLFDAENNKAFVLIEYFGYLRRNPNDNPDSDYTGYDFWLTKLNQFNGNFVNADMVKAFIVSGEYRQRFAAP